MQRTCLVVLMAAASLHAAASVSRMHCMLTSPVDVPIKVPGESVAKDNAIAEEAIRRSLTAAAAAADAKRKAAREQRHKGESRGSDDDHDSDHDRHDSDHDYGLDHHDHDPQSRSAKEDHDRFSGLGLLTRDRRNARPEEGLAVATEADFVSVRKVDVGVVVDMGRALPPLSHLEFDCPGCIETRCVLQVPVVTGTVGTQHFLLRVSSLSHSHTQWTKEGDQ